MTARRIRRLAVTFKLDYGSPRGKAWPVVIFEMCSEDDVYAFAERNGVEVYAIEPIISTYDLQKLAAQQ